RAAQSLAGEFYDHPSVVRLGHRGVRSRFPSLAADSRANAIGLARLHAKPTENATSLMGTGQRRDFAAEIASGAVDALAQLKAHEACHLDRRADGAFALLDSLGHGFLVV